MYLEEFTPSAQVLVIWTATAAQVYVTVNTYMRAETLGLDTLSVRVPRHDPVRRAGRSLSSYAESPWASVSVGVGVRSLFIFLPDSFAARLLRPASSAASAAVGSSLVNESDERESLSDGLRTGLREGRSRPSLPCLDGLRRPGRSLRSAVSASRSATSSLSVRSRLIFLP